MKIEIGERIRKSREEMRLTKEAFAKCVGISGQYLGLIERGINYPSIEKLKAICEFTNKSADYILFGKDYNMISTAKNMLTEFSDEQIIAACESLKNVALIIKK